MGAEIWESVITEERAAKGDLRLTYRENAFQGKNYISHAEPAAVPLVAAFVREDVLHAEAESHASRFLDMRRAFLAPVAHGFNRLYFSADGEGGRGGGSLEEDYQAVRRAIGKHVEYLVLLASEARVTAGSLRDFPPQFLGMIGEFRTAFRALSDVMRDLDKEREARRDAIR